MKALTVLFTLLVMPTVARSSTLIVPDDYPTIQAAIDAAVDWDTVLVRPGTYVENIDFVGKKITVKSESGPEVTIIDGNHAGSVVHFHNSEKKWSVLEGFSITNGASSVSGGGIRVRNFSKPTIRNNVIFGNWAAYDGGGVFCKFNDDPSGGDIVENVIYGNTAGRDGGGVYGGTHVTGNVIYGNTAGVHGGGVRGDNLVADNHIYGNTAGAGGGGIRGGDYIVGNVIHDNTALGGGGISLGLVVEGNLVYRNSATDYGGGIEGFGCTFSSTPVTVNNIIVENSADYGGGLHVSAGWDIFPSQSASLGSNLVSGNIAQVRGGGIHFTGFFVSSPPATLANSIIWNNDAPESPGMYVEYPEEFTVSYCDVQGGWPGEGNIDGDPMFVDPAQGDFHLRLGSPCVDAGTNDHWPMPAIDMEGDDRIVDGDLDGIAVADIGIDELLVDVAARFGTVNAAGEGLADVLRVNESAGSRKRIRRLAVGEPITVTVDAPPAGPSPAPFALYAWLGANDVTTCTPQPFGLGTMGFPTILSGGTPLPYRIWNNLGKEPWLGMPHFPSEPAPTIVVSAPGGWPNPITVTLQGFILDDGSQANKPASITNAVALMVE